MVAFAIGRRVGSAVVRNRIRRRIRAAVHLSSVCSGKYLISAGFTAATMPFSELQSHVERAFGRSNGLTVRKEPS